MNEQKNTDATVSLKGVEMMGKGDNMTHVCYNDIEAGMNGWCATCDNKNNNSVIFSFFFIYFYRKSGLFSLNKRWPGKKFSFHIFTLKLCETLCKMRYMFSYWQSFYFFASTLSAFCLSNDISLIKQFQACFAKWLFAQCCGSGMFIPVHGSQFFHPGTRISDPGSKIFRIPNPGSGSASMNLSIFNPKNYL
jgi:hypothetical protein